MREMKKYHLAHHYKNFELGFGVTSTYHSIALLGLQLMEDVFRQDMGCRVWDNARDLMT